MSEQETLAQLLMERRWTLSVAESCTGGLLGYMITSSPGASNYFHGGVTAYSDTAKIEMLGVTLECLRNHGSVSERTALAMASGVRDAFRTDVGAAITGIAGPSGGSDEKPVGTVCIAVMGDVDERAKTLNLKGDRDEVRRQATEEALKMVCEFLEQQ